MILKNFFNFYLFFFTNFLSLILVIILNIKIFYYKFFLKKKIIFFYHPKINLAKIHEYYVNDLFGTIKKNYKIIYCIQPSENYKISLQ